MSFWLTLAVTAGAVTGLMLLAFAVALRVCRYSVVDMFWGLGFALIAVIAYLASAGSGSPGRRGALLAATVLWGLRLSAHLGWRARGAGEDPRYAKLLARAAGSRAALALRRVFLAQAALVWVISAPVQAGMFQRGPAWTIAAGLAIWAVGLSFEAIGDWQLARFRSDPARRGTVLDHGLWRYTRHPNYFGDACTWWGLFVIGCGSWPGLITIFAPILMTFLLAAGTGKPPTERRLASRPGYAQYRARTSGFVPLRPRRAPAGQLPGGTGGRPGSDREAARSRPN